MSIRKRFLFAMLFTIVALAADGRVSVYKSKFDVPKPNTWSFAPVPVAAALPWYDSQLANMPSRWLKAFHTKGELLPALFLPIQFKNPKDLGVGKVLVAGRGLGDPNFAGTVVLLVHFDGKGAVGMILNRRTDVPLSRVLDLTAVKDRSDPVYLGGPVDRRPCLRCLTRRPRLKRLRTSSVGFIGFPTKRSLKKQFRRGLTLAFFAFTWDMPDGRRINCGPKCNWARGLFSRQTPPPYSIPIRILCGWR